MSTQYRKGGAAARVRAAVDVTEELLPADGRWAVDRIINGSVRTYLWANLEDGSVPAKFEHMRFYSTPNDYGTSRGLEASDLVHVIKSIDEVELFARDMNWLGSPAAALDKQTVFETVVGFRKNRPKKTFVTGNVAVMVWVNKADDDLVCKTEFFTVVAPGEVARCFGIESLGDAKRSYQKAADFIDEVHAELQQTSFPSRPWR